MAIFSKNKIQLYLMVCWLTGCTPDTVDSQKPNNGIKPALKKHILINQECDPNAYSPVKDVYTASELEHAFAADIGPVFASLYKSPFNNLHEAGRLNPFTLGYKQLFSHLQDHSLVGVNSNEENDSKVISMIKLAQGNQYLYTDGTNAGQPIHFIKSATEQRCKRNEQEIKQQDIINDAEKEAMLPTLGMLFEEKDASTIFESLTTEQAKKFVQVSAQQDLLTSSYAKDGYVVEINTSIFKGDAWYFLSEWIIYRPSHKRILPKNKDSRSSHLW